MKRAFEENIVPLKDASSTEYFQHLFLVFKNSIRNNGVFFI